MSCIGHMSTHGVCVMSSRLNSKLRLFCTQAKSNITQDTKPETKAKAKANAKSTVGVHYKSIVNWQQQQ